MLSIAYGEDQNAEKTQAHRPEFCYRAQGFDLNEVDVIPMTVGGRSVVARRLFTQKVNRARSSVTYWMTIGDRLRFPAMRRKVTLSCNTGCTLATLPMVAVSAFRRFGADMSKEFAIQQTFI